MSSTKKPDKTLPTNPAEFAAWYCAMLNPATIVDRRDDQGHTIYKAEIQQADMVWYLPSTGEVISMKDREYPVSGNYWTSTAIIEGTDGGTTANAYNGSSIYPENRNTTLHARAVRKRI